MGGLAILAIAMSLNAGAARLLGDTRPAAPPPPVVAGTPWARHDSIRLGQGAPGTVPSSRRMADGREWTTANLDADAAPSYCYDDADANCRRYGRLYTWASAQEVCQSLGGGWRLPTDEEWRQLAKRYGGVSADAADKGRAAFTALRSGGTSGFDAVLGGNRSDGRYTPAGGARVLLDGNGQQSAQRPVLQLRPERRSGPSAARG